jgi:hypothetical protein
MFYRLALRTALWTAGISLGLGLTFVRRSPWISDPTQDFGFTFQRAASSSFALSHGEVDDGGSGPVDFESLMLPEEAVTRVLKRKLRGVSSNLAEVLSKHMLSLCREHRMDPAFILALIEVESGFNVRARSHQGAMGLMQLMPATARVVGRQFNIRIPSMSSLLSNPRLNVSLGISYLRILRDKYQNDSPYFQFAAYNIGPARLDQLKSRPGGFRPAQTLKYYRTIRERMAFYRSLEHQSLSDEG